jgi:hypothetical protein
MSKFSLLFSVLFVFGTLNIVAQNADEAYYQNVANGFISKVIPAYTIKGMPISVRQDDHILARIYSLSPEGFIVLTSDTSLRPVYAFSTESNFSPEDIYSDEWLSLITADISSRIAGENFLSLQEKNNIHAEWQFLTSDFTKDSKFQQWPPAGSTLTGGWIETNWTQSAPYNMFCPMDLNAGNRSIAGCPSIAMAQILNYLMEINGTRFNNSDDYYHNYGTGNQYWIDNDSTAHDFPGFGSLNLMLDSLEFIYLSKAPISNTLAAALVFASGVACTQVYTASGSGTFGIEQAADAFQRFGFTDSRLAYPTDTNLNHDLAENIKLGSPAHLGIINVGSTAGHNVVVDGYNTDDFYHFNFGWGGSWNGWYTMPPTGMPYSLNVIEGIILDIYIDTVTANMPEILHLNNVSVYPNPATDYTVIDLGASFAGTEIEIYNVLGEVVFNQQATSENKMVLNLSGLARGIYMIRTAKKNAEQAVVKLIKN